MSAKDDQVRATIAEQASEWFVKNDEAPLEAQEAGALVDWLKASPVHVQEFLGVAAIARDLHGAGADPEFSLDTVLARARAEDDDAVQSIGPRLFAALREARALRWPSAAAITIAALAVASLGLLLPWHLRPGQRPAPAALHFATRHGEQQTYRLADNSVLHLNTDSAVTVRYSPTQRLVVLDAGEVDFEVVHEPQRAFRVLAGPAEIVDVGTRFDVRLWAESAVVTVVTGRVAVEPSRAAATTDAGSGPNNPGRWLQLSANQQLSITADQWPATAIMVDAPRATAWLHRQIVFDHEPLERVAAEFNRYAPKPIEITAPALRSLQVSGIFSTDDPNEFLAFLRSLEGVRVEVTATRIRVSQR